MRPLPSDFQYLLHGTDAIVVPMTMAWCVLRWFRLLPDPNHESKITTIAEESEKVKQGRIDKENRIRTYRTTPRAVFAGCMLAILVLLYVSRFHFQSDTIAGATVAQVGIAGAVICTFVGLLFAIGLRSLRLKAASNGFAKSPRVWGALVAFFVAIGVSSLILYYADFPGNMLHEWLVWGYVSLLCFYSIACLFGD